MSRTRLPADTRRRLAAAAAGLSRRAVAEIEARHRWYAALSAAERAAVAQLARAGVADFIAWLDGNVITARAGTAVFDVAPPELSRSITLGQTLELLRTVVDVVEAATDDVVDPQTAPAAREAILRYSREIAFRAAHVYAGAAEQRGAWDARLEALVVDAILRGDADDAMSSRASALGWGARTRVAVIVADPPHPVAGDPIDPADVLDKVHRSASRHGLHLLAAVQNGRVIMLVGETRDALLDATHLSESLGPGPIVVGPTVPHLFAAGRSARAAISGHAAAAAWPDAPRPANADDLLAERALLGDLPARNALVGRIVIPLRESAAANLLATATTFLECGRSIEATARTLFVHPNTVRYRLARITAVCGYDVTTPHEGDIVHLAIRYSRLVRAGSTTRAPV
ncbi:MAG: helix-turn-helix domain-containing protein [Tetrasphaera sp.]